MGEKIAGLSFSKRNKSKTENPVGTKRSDRILCVWSLRIFLFLAKQKYRLFEFSLLDFFGVHPQISLKIRL